MVQIEKFARFLTADVSEFLDHHTSRVSLRPCATLEFAGRADYWCGALTAPAGGHPAARCAPVRPLELRTSTMLKITFIQPDGSEQVVETEPGVTLM